jgi:hypothetical protein
MFFSYKNQGCDCGILLSVPPPKNVFLQAVSFDLGFKGNVFFSVTFLEPG